MDNKRRRSGGSQEGFHRQPQAFGRRAWRQALLWGRDPRLRWCCTASFLLLVLCLWNHRQLQYRGWLSKADCLLQEVLGERECIQVPWRSTESLWFCCDAEEDVWAWVVCFHRSIDKEVLFPVLCYTYVLFLCDLCLKQGEHLVAPNMFVFWEYFVVPG